jgi:hypothetical protein
MNLLSDIASQADLQALKLTAAVGTGGIVGFFTACILASKRIRRASLDAWKQADIFYRRRAIEDQKRALDDAIHQAANH